ncbi:MAG: hypothetical protein ABSE46_09955 [Terracidiphilus sp.]
MEELRSADYFFRRYNVIAELKCLVVDQTSETQNRLADLITARRDSENSNAQSSPEEGALWIQDSGGRKSAIRIDEDFQRAWAKILMSPIENMIRDANRQIRATKERLSVPSANGIILIFNEGNPLHARGPEHFARLVGEVIQKPQAGGRRFPHVQGMVYFSFGSITTFDQQTQKSMPFWLPAQVRGDHVEEIKLFQNDLKLGWYRFVEAVSGAPVVPHHRETNWPN